MSEKPKALELADFLDAGFSDMNTRGHSAKELRRQHALIEEMRKALQWTERALDSDHPAAISARAALAKAEAQS